MWKIVRWVGAVAGGLLMFAAGVSPNEAASNLSGWAGKVGLDFLAMKLDSAASDHWGFLVGGGLVAFSLIGWTIVYYRGKKFSQSNPKKSGRVLVRIKGGAEASITGNTFIGDVELVSAEDVKSLLVKDNVQIAPSQKDKSRD